MESLLNRATTVIARLWRGSAPLTATAVFMLGVLVVSLVGLIVDPRIVTGAPVWLKPVKFAISTSIYMLTLAWVFTLLPEWPRTRRGVGWLTAAVMVLEVGIIDLQAWRGTTSHFNVGTVFDGVLFTIMGAAIVVQTLTSIAVAVALWRQRFEDAALGWALRWGMVITILGAFTGGMMTRPTSTQLDEVRATGRMPISGAHTVGAPDGGPGLPGTGWSTDHGDVRVPHFLGLHAIQVLPLFALALRRRHAGRRYVAAAFRRPGPTEVGRVRMVLVAASSYGAFFAILLSQALRGQSLVRPDSVSIIVLTVWAILTAVALRRAASRRVPLPGQAVLIS